MAASSYCQKSLRRLGNLSFTKQKKRYISIGASSSSNQISLLSSLDKHNTAVIASQLNEYGYVRTLHPILTPQACQLLRNQIMPKLFRGDFDTDGNFRCGKLIMCNSWKYDRTIASIVMNKMLGEFICNIMGWNSVRIAQDDVVWKPPSISTDIVTAEEGAGNAITSTVRFHQDSAYISAQFEPYENNSVTLWIALDDADEETGCVEYAAGSHKWGPILHRRGNEVDLSSFHSSDETSYRDVMYLAAKLAGVDNPHNTIQSAPAKEGFAILHHQDCWHGSGPNLSSKRHRRALVIHYIRGDVTFRDRSNNNIYGRYKRYNSVELDESFFPIIFSLEGNRTVWIDDFIRE